MAAQMKFGYLNTLSVIKISGEDASTFLQGQLTNDIKSLDNEWQYNGYCSPKGRLLALLMVWRIDDDFFAFLSTDLTEVITKRLRMYIMRSKVNISVEENIEVTAYLSDRSLQRQNPNLSYEFSTLADKSVITVKGSTLLKLKTRYILLKEKTNNLESPYNSLDNEWSYLNTISGIPEINAKSSDLFIPQMVNLDYLDGINFKKGCYTGQEIVARMHYLGNLKQRMFLCDIDDQGVDTKINTGDKVFSVNLTSNETSTKKTFSDESKNNVGTIVSVKKNKALAVIKLASAQETLYLNDKTSIKVSKSQPYKLLTK